MKIIKLQAENFKRLTAVYIEAGDNAVNIVSGKNGAGKTSVLDAIMCALSGTKDAPDNPIHKGADKAEITLDLGDFKVTRTWKGETSTLKITNPDNSVKQKPQDVLNSLMGRFTFDPSAFMDAKPQDRRNALLGLVDVKLPEAWTKLGETVPDADPLGHIDTRKKEIYSHRTEVGRDLDKVNGALSTAKTKLPEGPAPARVSVEALTDELQKANEINNAIAADGSRFMSLKNKIDAIEADIKAIDEKIAYLKAKKMDLAAALIESQTTLSGITMNEKIDTTVLLDQINAASAANQAADQYQATVDNIAALTANETALSAEYEALTTKINAIDDIKASILASAAFPVAGLGVEDGDVTFNGIPFKDCSHAERLKISMAIGMSLNPKIRIMLIRDGEKFDSAAWDIINEMVKDKDYQVWIEKMDESGEVGIFIEDGHYGEIPKEVKKVKAPKPLTTQAATKDMTVNDVIETAAIDRELEPELPLDVPPTDNQPPDIAAAREAFDSLEDEVVEGLEECKTKAELMAYVKSRKAELAEFKPLGFDPTRAKETLERLKKILPETEA